MYIPDPDYHGSDNFEFVVNDCPFFFRMRNLYVEDRTAIVNITVRTDIECLNYNNVYLFVIFFKKIPPV